MTCTINQDIGNGSGFAVAPNGTPCNWSITAGPNNSQSGSCTTTGGTGTCTFSYVGSSVPGIDTIHASTTFTVNTVSLTRTTLASGTDVHGDGLDVHQTWVDAYVTISPASATNEVGTNHVLTVSVKTNDGSGSGYVLTGGVLVTASLPSDTASSAFVGGNTCTTASSGPGTGKCTVTISSPSTGQTAVRASFSNLQVGGVSGPLLSRATNDGKSLDSADATKTWVDAYVTISPASATNEVGTNHVLTVSVKTNDGSGSGYVLTGGVLVTASLPSDTASSAFVGGNTCTTASSGPGTGKCTVTISSPLPE